MSEAERSAAAACNDLTQAQKERQRVGIKIAKRYRLIHRDLQDLGGEAGVRAINDDINKLRLDRGVWETRIIELGGPDPAAKRRLYPDPPEVYRYVGAAIPFQGLWTPPSQDDA